MKRIVVYFSIVGLLVLAAKPVRAESGEEPGKYYVYVQAVNNGAPFGLQECDMKAFYCEAANPDNCWSAKTYTSDQGGARFWFQKVFQDREMGYNIYITATPKMSYLLSSKTSPDFLVDADHSPYSSWESRFIFYFGKPVIKRLTTKDIEMVGTPQDMKQMVKGEPHSGEAHIERSLRKVVPLQK
ncbi:MAG: hypothetical protein JXA24_06715 [Proteobacteria bacterium]|nr:hypothetical protein [Pseudomonadota bacterium]